MADRIFVVKDPITGNHMRVLGNDGKITKVIERNYRPPPKRSVGKEMASAAAREALAFSPMLHPGTAVGAMSYGAGAWGGRQLAEAVVPAFTKNDEGTSKEDMLAAGAPQEIIDQHWKENPDYKPRPMNMATNLGVDFMTSEGTSFGAGVDVMRDVAHSVPGLNPGQTEHFSPTESKFVGLARAGGMMATPQSTARMLATWAPRSIAGGVGTYGAMSTETEGKSSAEIVEESTNRASMGALIGGLGAAGASASIARGIGKGVGKLSEIGRQEAKDVPSDVGTLLKDLGASTLGIDRSHRIRRAARQAGINIPEVAAAGREGGHIANELTKVNSAAVLPYHNQWLGVSSDIQRGFDKAESAHGGVVKSIATPTTSGSKVIDSDLNTFGERYFGAYNKVMQKFSDRFKHVASQGRSIPMRKFNATRMLTDLGPFVKHDPVVLRQVKKMLALEEQGRSISVKDAMDLSALLNEAKRSKFGGSYDLTAADHLRLKRATDFIDKRIKQSAYDLHKEWTKVRNEYRTDVIDRFRPKQSPKMRKLFLAMKNHSLEPGDVNRLLFNGTNFDSRTYRSLRNALEEADGAKLDNKIALAFSEHLQHLYRGNSAARLSQFLRQNSSIMHNSNNATLRAAIFRPNGAMDGIITDIIGGHSANMATLLKNPQEMTNVMQAVSQRLPNGVGELALQAKFINQLSKSQRPMDMLDTHRAAVNQLFKVGGNAQAAKSLDEIENLSAVKQAWNEYAASGISLRGKDAATVGGGLLSNLFKGIKQRTGLHVSNIGSATRSAARRQQSWEVSAATYGLVWAETRNMNKVLDVLYQSALGPQGAKDVASLRKTGKASEALWKSIEEALNVPAMLQHQISRQTAKIGIDPAGTESSLERLTEAEQRARELDAEAYY